MMQRSADHAEEPEARDIGQGYPEEGQSGTGAGPHTEQRSDNEPNGAGDDAPPTSTDDDGDAGQATGNPRAAGSDGTR